MYLTFLYKYIIVPEMVHPLSHTQFPNFFNNKNNIISYIQNNLLQHLANVLKENYLFMSSKFFPFIQQTTVWPFGTISLYIIPNSK